MEVQLISKEELIQYFINNGFIYDAISDKFTKHEVVNTGKIIINGKEIVKTQEVDINVEYIYTGSIEDENKSVTSHQLKLIVNENELEFLITDKYDLHDFFGLNVGEIPEDKQKKRKTKYIEDIVC